MRECLTTTVVLQRSDRVTEWATRLPARGEFEAVIMIDRDRRKMSGGQLHRVMRAGRAVWSDITRNHRVEGELAGERTYSARMRKCV